MTQQHTKTSKAVAVVQQIRDAISMLDTLDHDSSQLRLAKQWVADGAKTVYSNHDCDVLQSLQSRLSLIDAQVSSSVATPVDAMKINSVQMYQGKVYALLVQLSSPNGQYADEYAALPAAVMYGDRLYVKTSWSSDTLNACYKPACHATRPIATPVDVSTAR